MTSPSTPAPPAESARPAFDCLCGDGKAVFVEEIPDGWRHRCDACDTEYELTVGKPDDEEDDDE